MKEIKDPNLPKKLQELGICISLSQARRMVSQITQEKLDQLIKKKLNEKGELIK